jgi:membrane protein YqaA with SNARE-associated domain
VALNPELVGFVKEGLARGVARDEISGVLIKTGWPAEQVSRAMAMYAETPFAIPVPRPVTTGSMRDAFMHVLMFFTLMVSSWNFGSLVFEFIDRAFPDPAMSRPYYSGSALQAIRWDLSSLVVAFPLFLVVSWRVSLAMKRDPTRRASKTRRSLTYIMLFVGSLTLIGDVITLIYNFLGGELSARFVLKVLTVAVIAGGVVTYYFADLRSEEKEPQT